MSIPTAAEPDLTAQDDQSGPPTPERGRVAAGSSDPRPADPTHRAARRAPGPCRGLFHGAGCDRLSDGCL